MQELIKSFIELPRYSLSKVLGEQVQCNEEEEDQSELVANHCLPSTAHLPLLKLILPLLVRLHELYCYCPRPIYKPISGRLPTNVTPGTSHTGEIMPHTSLRLPSFGPQPHTVYLYWPSPTQPNIVLRIIQLACNVLCILSTMKRQIQRSDDINHFFSHLVQK